MFTQLNCNRAIDKDVGSIYNAADSLCSPDWPTSLPDHERHINHLARIASCI